MATNDRKSAQPASGGTMSEPTPPTCFTCLYCGTPLGNDETSHCAALRLRVEELTHERDQARQAPKIELEQETDGRWLAEYKEIPGMMVYGATIVEALRKLADLIEAEEK